MSLLHLSNHNLHMTGEVIDISIPLDFDGPQPSHFGAAPAQSQPMRTANFVGDTRHGGSCNATVVTLNPHCNGTHTECVGHLTDTRVSIHEVCPALPLLANLITVECSSAMTEGVTNRFVSKAALQPKLNILMEQNQTYINGTPTALIIRTLPNSTDKTNKTYHGTEDTPFVAVDAAELLVASGIDHLLIDTPSIDPYHDHGKLAAHRVLFGLPPYEDCPTPTLADAQRAHSTLTEMIFVSNSVPDGMYLLNLQIPPFCLDAAPSRPLLYPLESS